LNARGQTGFRKISHHVPVSVDEFQRYQGIEQEGVPDLVQTAG
jgi:hypothetical protein